MGKIDSFAVGLLLRLNMNRDISSSCRHAVVGLATAMLAVGAGACDGARSGPLVTENVRAAGGADPVLLDVNDVSVLFLYDPATQKMVPDVALAPFLSSALFDAVI